MNLQANRKSSGKQHRHMLYLVNNTLQEWCCLNKPLFGMLYRLQNRLHLKSYMHLQELLCNHFHPQHNMRLRHQTHKDLLCKPYQSPRTFHQIHVHTLFRKQHRMWLEQYNKHLYKAQTRRMCQLCMCLLNFRNPIDLGHQCKHHLANNMPHYMENCYILPLRRTNLQDFRRTLDLGLNKRYFLNSKHLPLHTERQDTKCHRPDNHLLIRDK